MDRGEGWGEGGLREGSRVRRMHGPHRASREATVSPASSAVSVRVVGVGWGSGVPWWGGGARGDSLLTARTYHLAASEDGGLQLVRAPVTRG